MGTVSGTLRAERERAGLSLEDISARTRIKISFLEAIEREQFESLPGPFFTRAFLRTYARELNLPADEILHRYDAESAELNRGGRPTRPMSEPVRTALDDRESSARALRSITSSRWRGWAIVPAAVILLAAVIVFARPGRDDPAEPQAVGTSGETGTTPAAPAGVRARETDMLVVEVRTTDATWIAATADGKRVAYRLFQPGDRVTLQARQELSFRIGNAGAFSYSINGATGVPVGDPGDVREFTITRENYRSLLASR